MEILFKMKDGVDKYVEIYRPFEMFHIGVKDDEFILINTSKETTCKDIINLDLHITNWGFYLTNLKINDVKTIKVSTKEDDTGFLVNKHITSQSSRPPSAAAD